MTMEKFINDILMVVFFFTVGLEIKREVVCGELSSFKKAILPVIAAFGGVVAPALIFTLVNKGTLAASGWGIPTATDIAFAVGILSILGDKVPVSLKVFLTALAIADDLIAILVVALFYGGNINLPLLLVALCVVLFVALMKRLGEKRLGFYFVPAIIVWFLFYYSGIHATMTGVVMAMFIPMEARYNKAKFHRRSKILWDSLLEAEAAQKEAVFPNGP
jgi:NhaA family Na+:H+ antiporter